MKYRVRLLFYKFTHFIERTCNIQTESHLNIEIMKTKFHSILLFIPPTNYYVIVIFLGFSKDTFAVIDRTRK